MSQEMCEAEGLPQLCRCVSDSSCVCALPCLFQRCPLIDREVTAFREIREEVGVISTWILRAPSLLLLFSAAPCSDDLMALPTWRPRRSAQQLLLPERMPEFHRRINEVSSRPVCPFCCRPNSRLLCTKITTTANSQMYKVNTITGVFTFREQQSKDTFIKWIQSVTHWWLQEHFLNS